MQKKLMVSLLCALVVGIPVSASDNAGKAKEAQPKSAQQTKVAAQSSYTDDEPYDDDRDTYESVSSKEASRAKYERKIKKGGKR